MADGLFLTRQLEVHGVPLPTATDQGFDDLSGLSVELLEVIWSIEGTTSLFETLSETLGEVVVSDLITADELPSPTEAERAAPVQDGEPALQAELFG